MPIVDPNDPMTWDVHPERRRGQWNIGTGIFKLDGGPMWSAHEVRVGYCRFIHRRSADRSARNLIRTCGLSPADRVLLVGDNWGFVTEAMRSLRINAVPTDNAPYVHSIKAQSEDSHYLSRIAAAGITDADGGYIDNRSDFVPTNGRRIITSTPVADILAILSDGGPRARVTVLDEGMENQGSRNRIKTELGGDPTWVISKGSLQWLEDVECTDLSSRMAATGSVVAHIITPFSSGGIKRDSEGRIDPEPNPNNWKWITGTQTRVGYLDDDVKTAARSWKGLLPADRFIHVGSYNIYV